MLTGSDTLPEFPRPRIPILPVLGWNSFGPFELLSRQLRKTLTGAARFANGTAALAAALRHGGVVAGNDVLVPAYHCQSMIEPILAVGATPRLVRINADLSVDLAHARRMVTSDTRAFLLPHYFGFSQPFNDVQTFCSKGELLLVEDCAHALFNNSSTTLLSCRGDYAAYSVRKFFPGGEGGLLLAANRSLANLESEAVASMDNLRFLLNMLEEAASHGRLRPLSASVCGVTSAVTRWSRSLSREHATAALSNGVFPSSIAFRYFDANRPSLGMGSATKFIMMFASLDRIRQRRQHNYRLLAGRLADIPRSRLLMPRLPDDVVPYMLPIVVDDSAKVFSRLKREGVPLYRWEELLPGDCEISREYSRTLLQIPCHQELREKEVNWMTKAIERTLRRRD